MGLLGFIVTTVVRLLFYFIYIIYTSNLNYFISSDSVPLYFNNLESMNVNQILNDIFFLLFASS